MLRFRLALDQISAPPDDVSLRNLLKIVILGRDPKNRHRTEALLAKTLGLFDGRQCLIDRVQRTGE